MIGKYSSLACSNTVYITSYYNGTAYQYIMVKSGNSITTNLVLKSYTEEKNGVEVTIKSIADFTPFYKALNCITFFPNVYVDGNSFKCKEINEVKLKRFNNFAAATRTIDDKLLLGNVLYPCNIRLMPSHVSQFLRELNTTGIVIKFDVGEINITPNRENIIYTSDTIKKITERVEAAKKELEDLISKNVSRDCTDILEYYQLMSKTIQYEPVENKLIQWGGYRVVVKNVPSISVTYRGENLIENVGYIGYILHMTVPNFRGVIAYDKIYTKKPPYREGSKTVLSGQKFLVCNIGLRMTESIKMFVKKNYNEYVIVTEFSRDELEAYIDKELVSWQKSSDDKKNFIITGVYESFLSRSKKIDFNTDANYLSFKEKLSKGIIAMPTIKEPILYTFKNGFREKVTFRTFNDAVSYIKGRKKGVILLNMEVSEYSIMHIADIKKMDIIKARKDIVAELKAMNLSCIVNLEYLTHEDPLLAKVCTASKYFSGDIPNFEAIVSMVPETLRKDFYEIRKLVYIITHDSSYVQIARKNGKIDQHTEVVCQRLHNYMKKYKEVSDIVDSSGIGRDSGPLSAAVIMKTKSFRVNYSTYKKVKENKLINILCRK